MHILIGAGGTGGHVYPALAAAEALRILKPEGLQMVFVGTVDGFERPLVESSGLHFDAYEEVLAGPLNGVNPLKVLSSLFRLGLGALQSLRLLRRHRPSSLLLTGGWTNVPLGLAAWMLRVPVLVYLPDIEPALTIRVLRHIARRVAITVPESAAYFRPGQAVVTGYPLRADRTAATRDEALRFFELDPDKPVLLVFGGSRGARSINSALITMLPQLLSDGVQVIHLTGTLDWPRVQAEVAALDLPAGYHPYAYLHDEMGLAYAAADLVLCRAGASTLGELPYFRLPSILVPYPHAWHYQRVNADYLAERGAAVRMKDDEMSDKLYPLINDLLSDPEQLRTMADHAASLRHDDGAQALAQALIGLAEGQS